jgi:hypothetical protein
MGESKMEKIMSFVIVGLLMFVLSPVAVTAQVDCQCQQCKSDCYDECYEMWGEYNPQCIKDCILSECPLVNISTGQGIKKLGRGINSLETQTIILNNISNSFPMFSNAEYVDFTIGKDTITLTLDLNASFDGLYNLSNLTGTDISAAGSSAELEYFSTTYNNDSYDQKWKSSPYFDDTENRLYLLSGSGLIAKLKLEITENSKDKTIPKVVGVGDLVGRILIDTVAEGTNSNYNYLDSNIKGVGYADLYVQYAPDTRYENIIFIPTFSDCENVLLMIRSSSGSESVVYYAADIVGVANGAKSISGVSHDLELSLDLDVEYFPISYQNFSYDQKWKSAPYFDDTENRLYLLAGSGLITKLKLEILQKEQIQIIIIFIRK